MEFTLTVGQVLSNYHLESAISTTTLEHIWSPTDLWIR